MKICLRVQNPIYLLTGEGSRYHKKLMETSIDTNPIESILKRIGVILR